MTENDHGYPPLDKGFEVNGRDYGLMTLRLVLFVMVVAFVGVCVLVGLNGSP
jgi:hypothetical protein